MRVGLSWEIRAETPAGPLWAGVIAAIKEADALGFESAWVAETRDCAAACTQPTVFLTYAARLTRSIHLRALGRTVKGEIPVRLVEEVALLDQFSHGRGGVAYASGRAQSIAPQAVHETIEFARAAWMTNEIRYLGQHVRFPSHTPDGAPHGPSYAPWEGEYVPQWEWGAARSTSDFLALTPKPATIHVPTYVSIDDDETLEWAAKNGVSPYAGVNLTNAEAVERLARYRRIADAAGRHSFEVDAVIERNVAIDGASDAHTFGGSTHDIACAIREAAAATRASHFVWRHRPGVAGELARFANEVQVKLQA